MSVPRRRWMLLALVGWATRLGAGQDPVAARPPGQVITVLGPIAPESLGVTLMHEHLASNMLLPEAHTGYSGKGKPPPLFIRRFQESGRYFRVPRTQEQLAFWDRPNLTAGMIDTLALGWLTKSQFVLDDTTATQAELASFRGLGGGTVVDVTPIGLGRNPERLRSLARQSRVQVVMGTGWYRWMFHPPNVGRSTVTQLADRMTRDITVGVGSTGIRAGIIGEIPIDGAGLRLAGPPGLVYPDSAIVARRQAIQARIRSGSAPADSIYDREEIKVLRAAARASARTGVAITLHAPDPWISYLDILAEEGADLSRVVIGHADLVLLEDSLARRAFARGVTLQIDYQLQQYGGRDIGPFDQLLDRVAWAVREGFADQIVVSLDLCFRQGLTKYGGGGYRTLFERIIPGLKARGVSEAAVRQILVENPRRILTVGG